MSIDILHCNRINLGSLINHMMDLALHVYDCAYLVDTWPRKVNLTWVCCPTSSTPAFNLLNTCIGVSRFSHTDNPIT